MKVVLCRTALCGACAWLVAGLAGGSAAFAEDAVPVPPVTVEGQGESGGGMADKTPDIGTTYEIGREGIQTFGGAGGINTYYDFKNLPSVTAEQIDAYGGTVRLGGNKGLRMRGEMFQHGGGGTVEGLPLTAMDPGMGAFQMIDNENFSRVSVSQGPLAPYKLTVFSLPGTFDASILWPSMKPGVTAQQSFGSFDFKRSFARFDTGDLGQSTAAFASVSWTDADKWRGPGKEIDGRTNVETGFVSSPNDKIDMKVFFVYNDTAGDSYRGLTYAQAQNLKNYRSYDFLPNPVAGSLAYYYKDNRFWSTNYGTLAEVTYHFSDATRLIVKPYYVYENGEFFLQQSTATAVRDWIVDHDFYGVNTELQTRQFGTDFRFGHFYMSSEPPAPPVAWKTYTATAAGGLTYSGWALLTRIRQNSEVQNLYATGEHRFGPLKIEAGGRIVRQTVPGLDSITPAAGLGDTSLDTALAAGTTDPTKSVSAFAINTVLPYAAAAYDLAPNLQLKASFGQNYGALAYDMWNAIQSMGATNIKAAGFADANALWHTMKPEISTGTDFGLRWDYGMGYIEPTLYYSQAFHKDVVYNPGFTGAPANGVGLNVAKTTAYGAQLMAHWLPARDLDMFWMGSYNRNTFDSALPVYATATTAQRTAAAAVKGKQLPDTPVWMTSVGAAMHFGEFTFTPVGNFMGSRFADITRSQPVPAYATLDLALEYEHEVRYGTLKASLAVANVFDKSYISMIDTNYATSPNGATFYPGAPRTIVGRLGLKF